MTNPPPAAVEPLRARLDSCGFTATKDGFVRARGGVGCRIKAERFRFPIPGRTSFRWVLEIVFQTGTGELKFPGLRERCSGIVSLPTTALRGNDDRFWAAVSGDETWLADYLTHLDQDLAPFIQHLDSIDTAVAAIETLGPSTGFTLGIALARMGRKDEARRHFRRAAGDPAAIAQRAALEGVDL